MFALAMMMTAASVASAPTLLPGAGFTAGNPPATPYSARTGFVGVHVTVDSKGLAHDCVVLSSSGNNALDTKICEMAVAKMRFTAARDSAGRPMAGTYVGYIGWNRTSPDTNAAPRTPALVPGRAELIMTTDADGRIDECRVQPLSDSRMISPDCAKAKSLPFATVFHRPMTATKAVRMVVHVNLGPGAKPERNVLNDKVTVLVLAADLTVGRDGSVLRCIPQTTSGDPDAGLIDPCVFVPKTPFPASPDAARTGSVSLIVVDIARD